MMDERSADLLETLNILQTSFLGSSSSGKEIIDCGPFRVFVSGESDVHWMNFAVPTSKAETAAEVEALVQVFHSKQRRPRVESLQTLWPRTSLLLEAFGFELQARMPIMICTREGFKPAPRAVTVELLSSSDDPVPSMITGNTAFSDDAPVTEARIENWRKRMDSGNFYWAQAIAGSTIAGVGCLMACDGAAELAGIGTLLEFRRRGIALSVSTALIEKIWSKPAQESIVWLSAADETAASMYRKLGFTSIGIQENWQWPLPHSN
jgi:ribosomal protein S18 acetylase RimI-like enzyme